MELLTESSLFRIFIQGFYPDNHSSVFFKYLKNPNISLAIVYSSNHFYKQGTCLSSCNTVYIALNDIKSFHFINRMLIFIVYFLKGNLSLGKLDPLEMKTCIRSLFCFLCAQKLSATVGKNTSPGHKINKRKRSHKGISSTCCRM